MKIIKTYNDLLQFCTGLSEQERLMPAQVGTETGVFRIKSGGHCTDAPDLGSNTLILDTV
jgi:hypothetical protein